jgi:hypothetical protein
MRLRRFSSAAFVLAALGASWTGCKGSSRGTSAAGDDAGDDADDATLAPDTFECNPCFQVCSCTPGATLFSPGSCTTFTCGADGLWGGRGCIGLGCVDAAEDDSEDDQGTDASAGDAATDAVNDAHDAATIDASDASDASGDGDANDDVAMDGIAD